MPDGWPELALSLTQPWATLVVTGQKKIETRGWRTGYRGLLGIHASKGFPGAAKDLCATEPFMGALYRESFRAIEDLPTGCLLGTVRLLDCIPTAGLGLASQERAFGDFSPGRWAWMLAGAVMFDEPIPMKGALSLWKTTLLDTRKPNPKED